MAPEPVMILTITKLDKRNKTSQKFANDVMSKNCDTIVLFPIYRQCGAIRKPETGSRTHNL